MSITDEQIEQLGTEAVQAGDLEMAALCTLALGGTLSRDQRGALLADWPGLEADPYSPDSERIARTECERVIALARGR